MFHFYALRFSSLVCLICNRLPSCQKCKTVPSVFFFFFFFPDFCSHLKFWCGSFEIHLRVRSNVGRGLMPFSPPKCWLVCLQLVHQFTMCLPIENIAFIKRTISRYIWSIPMIFLCIFPILILFLRSTAYSSTYFPWYSSMLSVSFRIISFLKENLTFSAISLSL